MTGLIPEIVKILLRDKKKFHNFYLNIFKDALSMYLDY